MDEDLLFNRIILARIHTIRVEHKVYDFDSRKASAGSTSLNLLSETQT